VGGSGALLAPGRRATSGNGGEDGSVDGGVDGGED
jgi:hypothetical protein